MGILVGVRLHPSLHEYPGCMPDSERDCGRRWQSGVTASYGRGTEKDGVQRSEESIVMGRRTRRAQAISILSL
jgi:hypothetical protein